MVYVSNIITAAIAFPFIAIILTVPLLVYHYHRYGSLTILRSVILYSFMFYLVAAYCLIILPLPPRSVVAHLTTPRYNLVPFTFVREFINSTHFVWTEPSSYLATLKQAATIQPLFNIFLTVPFIYVTSLKRLSNRPYYLVLRYPYSLNSRNFPDCMVFILALIGYLMLMTYCSTSLADCLDFISSPWSPFSYPLVKVWIKQPMRAVKKWATSGAYWHLPLITVC